MHHCLVFKDPTASYVTDTVGGNCGGPSIGDLIGGYTPGASPTIFPSSETFATGITLEAGSNIILALHYPEGSFGEYDQTKVNFYFYPDPVENFRDVFAERLIENWFFFLAANQLTEVQDTYVVNSNDLTMMSVFPHMHLLGSSIESYAVSPINDTIPLIRINEWDFEWQDFYFFKYLQHIPSGSIFYGKGMYDNTAANPNNPNSPPIDVFPGLNTTDEMFLFYFHYMLYETGDELINVDSLNSIWLAGQTSKINTTVLDKYKLKTYPNPFTENTTIEFTLNEPASVNIYIYDVQGMLVKKIGRINQAQGVQNFIWDGANSDGAQVPSGLYYGSMLINGEAIPIKLIRK